MSKINDKNYLHDLFINEAKGALNKGGAGGGGGLSSDEKTLLLALQDNNTYTVDMSATLNQLRNLFAGGKPNTYSVTYNLTDVASDNMVETAKEAFPFTATLSVAEGLLIREDNLSVTMGGKDITDSVYADGVISIPCVTGEIVITAQAKDKYLLYVLSEETVFDGTSATPRIDTGISLFDTHKSFSILFEFSGGENNVFAEADPSNDKYEPYKGNGYAFGKQNGYNWRSCFAQQYADHVGQGGVTNVKVVVTYDHTTKKYSQYYISGGALTVWTATWNMATLVGKTSGLRVGVGYNYNYTAGFKGTIHSLEVHSKVVDESTINAFMGGGLNGIV